MIVLVTCKNEEDPIKNKALEWSQECGQTDFHRDASSMGILSGELETRGIISRQGTTKALIRLHR